MSNDNKQVCLDGDFVIPPLIVRSRKAGDFFYPIGFGKRKKLQDFFVDAKVPVNIRDHIPIVLSNNDIIWIAGYRADDRFKITTKSAKFVKLEIGRLSKNAFCV
ncbi:Lysidine-tRNA(Ile) synthetase [Candidatus Magnetoovum chiemensis]|nr:Lysidine-tRNA(Ile) synthetase [Candidatus Magnetoovum chiemensis]